jgi:hypothetical protein
MAASTATHVHESKKIITWISTHDEKVEVCHCKGHNAGLALGYRRLIVSGSEPPMEGLGINLHVRSHEH